MSLYVVRAFVQLREILVSNKELALRLDELERKLSIRELTNPPDPPRRGIGFTADFDRK